MVPSPTSASCDMEICAAQARERVRGVSGVRGAVVARGNAASRGLVVLRHRRRRPSHIRAPTPHHCTADGHTPTRPLVRAPPPVHLRPSFQAARLAKEEAEALEMMMNVKCLDTGTTHSAEDLNAKARHSADKLSSPRGSSVTRERGGPTDELDERICYNCTGFEHPPPDRPRPRRPKTTRRRRRWR